MVNFSVFNELSLPIEDIKEFENFFKVLNMLREFGMEKIRMDREFTKYPEILPNITFGELLGQLKDKTQQRKLKSFINNSISVIETPLIKKDDEKEQEELLLNEYFYNSNSNRGALACSDIWNTIAVSFLSNEQWDKDTIRLQKHTISNNTIDIAYINIRHASKVEHLDSHQDFFQDLEKEKRLNITQDNFWNRRDELFPNKIKFCKEVEKQIKILDKTIFQQAISILRDIETDKKLITDYKYSGEDETVKTNPKMIAQRKFTINGEKIFFENHIKSLSNANRIYFLEQDDNVYIGYIGKHLLTKKFQ